MLIRKGWVIIMDKKTVGAFVAGTLIGVGAGIMLAPKSGKETRKDIVKGAKKIGKKAKDMDLEEVKEMMFDKVESTKKAIKKRK